MVTTDGGRLTHRSDHCYRNLGSRPAPRCAVGRVLSGRPSGAVNTVGVQILRCRCRSVRHAGWLSAVLSHIARRSAAAVGVGGRWSSFACAHSSERVSLSANTSRQDHGPGWGSGFFGANCERDEEPSRRLHEPTFLAARVLTFQVPLVRLRSRPLRRAQAATRPHPRDREELADAHTDAMKVSRWLLAESISIATLNMWVDEYVGKLWPRRTPRPRSGPVPWALCCQSRLTTRSRCSRCWPRRAGCPT
jgi:hypothetical protein